MGLALLVMACGPAGGAAPGGGSSAAKPAQTGPKTMNMQLQEEPVTMLLYGRPGEGGTTTARYERFYEMQAQLTRFAEDTNPIPWAAVKVPTIEDGDWKLNPDGSMVVTWKIRPDVYWHDGQPLVADDFVFGLEVVKDPKLAVSGLGELTKITGVTAPDPKTLVVNWKSLSVNANTNSTEGVPAIPKHQVEQIYKTADVDSFQGSQVWRTEFIGYGPYKLSSWNLGAGYIIEAFDKYFLGRPKIDRITFQYAPDPQVITARLLSGAIDMVPPGTTIKPEQMVQIKQQWGPDGGVAVAAPNDLRVLHINERDQSKPWATDPRFRQAMLLSINRPDLAQVLQYGFIEVSYFFGFPKDPTYKMALDRKVDKWDYDPKRAAQLFSAAGWNKGSDGLLHNAAGQVVPTFTCCRLASNQDSNDIRESLAIGTGLKEQGVDAQHPVPDAPAAMAAADARKFRALSDTGATFGNYRVVADQHWASFVAVQIPTEENKWQGLNSAIWQDAKYEDLFSKAQSTLNFSQRTDIQFQMLQIMMDQLPALPTYYNPLGLVYRKGVTGVGTGIPLNRGIMWNIETWDIQ